MDYKLEDLKVWDDKIVNLAKGHKLDWFDLDYEVIDYQEMIGAMVHHGMPSMYSHWSFGKEFLKTKKGYDAGRQGLAFEIVINSNPCISSLMEDNDMVMQDMLNDI